MNRITTKEKLELLGLNQDRQHLIDVIVENVLDVKGYNKTVGGKVVQVKQYQRKGDKKIQEEKGMLRGVTPQVKPTEKPKESPDKKGIPPEATELMREYKRILEVMKKMVVTMGGIEEARNDPNYNSLVEQQRERRKKYDSMVNEAMGKTKVEKQSTKFKGEERKPETKGKKPETTPPEAREYLRMYKDTLEKLKKLQSVLGDNYQYNSEYQYLLNDKKTFYAEYERLTKEYQVLNKIGKYATAQLPYDLGKYNYKPKDEHHWDTLGEIQERVKEVERYQNSIVKKYKDAKYEFNMPELIKISDGLNFDNKPISDLFESEEKVSQLVKSNASIEEYNKAITEFEKSVLDATEEVKSYEDRLANLTEGKESLIEGKEVNMWGWNKDIDIYDKKIAHKLGGKVAQSSTKFKNYTNDLLSSLNVLNDEFRRDFPEFKEFTSEFRYKYEDIVNDIREVADDLQTELSTFLYSDKTKGMELKERKIKLYSAYFEANKKIIQNRLKSLYTSGMKKVNNFADNLIKSTGATPNLTNFDTDPQAISYKLQFGKFLEYLPKEYINNIEVFTGKSEFYRTTKEHLWEDDKAVIAYGDREDLKKAGGFYKDSERAIYSGKDAGLWLSSHEAAHAIHHYIERTNKDLYLETLRMFTAAENKTKELRENLNIVQQFSHESPYFTRRYGETNMYEHFATMVDMYFTNTEKMKQKHPDLYEFVHTKVMRKQPNEQWRELWRR